MHNLSNIPSLLSSSEVFHVDFISCSNPTPDSVPASPRLPRWCNCLSTCLLGECQDCPPQDCPPGGQSSILNPQGGVASLRVYFLKYFSSDLEQCETPCISVQTLLSKISHQRNMTIHPDANAAKHLKCDDF